MSIVQTPTRSYTQRRLDSIGLTEAQNFFEIEQETPDGGYHKIPIKMIEEDANGNLIINYWHLNRMRVQRKDESTKNYQRMLNHQKIRWEKPVNPKDKYTYRHKGFSAVPYYPKWVIEAFERGEKIETLIITEGELKALKMAMHGLPTIAIPGISVFKDKNSGQLFLGIQQIIQKCGVRNVIILYDGDATDLSKTALKEKKDLFKRPASFINSATKLREVLKPYNVDVIWASNVIKTFDDEEAKALDDMMCAAPHLIDQFKSELLNPNTEAKIKYFNKFNISNTTTKLYRHFKVSNADTFYSFHDTHIEDREFIFRGTTYQFDEETQKVKIVIPKDAQNYLRIGDTYFEIYESTRPNGMTYRKMDIRQKGTIVDDHKKDFLQYIAKYKGRCNVPNYLDYQQVYNYEYNMQFPIPSDIYDGNVQEDDVPISLDFVKHIFGRGQIEWNGHTINEWELGLDYLYLLLFNRKRYGRFHVQRLPILVLVSKENHTGKSLFAEKWMQKLLGKNAVSITNEDFESEFNAIYAYARLILIEEAMLNKKRISEKIKALSTSKTINANDKNIRKETVDFVGCFIVNSNDEKRAVYIAEDDIRYWVRKVPVPTKNNPNIEDELEAEIPQFLAYLLRRGLYMSKILKEKEISRMYFPPKLIETEAMRVLRGSSKPKEAQLIELGIEDMFAKFPKEKKLWLSVKDICKEILGGFKDHAFIAECLRDHIKAEQYTNSKGKKVTKKYKYPVLERVRDEETQEYNEQVYYMKSTGRPYIFNRADWIEDNEDDNGTQAELPLEETTKGNTNEKVGTSEPNVTTKTNADENADDDIPF